MDVTEIRRANVDMLVTAAGGPTEFGKRIERDQAQVSQWLSPTNPKPIGGRLARYIEGQLGHDRGWLDRPQWTSAEDSSPSQSQPMRLDPEMLAETHRVLRELYHEHGRTYSLEEPAAAARFVQVYAMRSAMPDQPSQDEWVQFGRKLAAITPQGAANGRDDGVPVEGTGAKRMAGGVRRRKA